MCYLWKQNCSKKTHKSSFESSWDQAGKQLIIHSSTSLFPSEFIYIIHNNYLANPNCLHRFWCATRFVQRLVTDANVRRQRCIPPDAAAAASIRRLPGSSGSASQPIATAFSTVVRSSSGILSARRLSSHRESTRAEQLHRQRGRGRQRRLAGVTGSRSLQVAAWWEISN